MNFFEHVLCTVSSRCHICFHAITSSSRAFAPACNTRCHLRLHSNSLDTVTTSNLSSNLFSLPHERHHATIPNDANARTLALLQTRTFQEPFANTCHPAVSTKPSLAIKTPPHTHAHRASSQHDERCIPIPTPRATTSPPTPSSSNQSPTSDLPCTVIRRSLMWRRRRI